MEELHGPQCPHCQYTDHQQKVGRNPSGSQRYVCAHCQRKYTPHPTPRGYADRSAGKRSGCMSMG